MQTTINADLAEDSCRNSNGSSTLGQELSVPGIQSWICLSLMMLRFQSVSGPMCLKSRSSLVDFQVSLTLCASNPDPLKP